MKKKYFFLFLIIILLSNLTIAQYETFQNINEDSAEYQNYKTCIDSCSQCETNCKNNLLREAAFTKNDETFCQQLTEPFKTSCLDNVYRNKAIQNNDITFCNKISNDNDKNSCSLSVTVTKATETENINECDNLDKNLVDACKSSYYNTLAITKLDKSYCNNLNLNEKTFCEQRVNEQLMLTQPAQEQPQETKEEQPAQNGLIYLIAGTVIFIIIFIILLIVIKKLFRKKPKEEPLILQQQVQQKEVNQNVQ